MSARLHRLREPERGERLVWLDHAVLTRLRIGSTRWRRSVGLGGGGWSDRPLGARGRLRSPVSGLSASGLPCWLRLGRAMVKVLLFLGGLAILLVSSRQVFLMFRDGSFRARGNRLIVRNAHPIIFWMNFVGLVLFGVVGVALICWQLLT